MPPEIIPIDTPNGRFYRTPAGEFPSVNTILDATAPESEQARLKRWRQKRQDCSEKKENAASINACKRGTLLHEAIANYLAQREEPDHLPDVVIPYWRSILPWLKRVGSSALVSYPGFPEKHLAIELPLYEASLGYAGTPDWVGEWESGSLWLVDFKSSHRKKRKTWMTRARLQCAAYRRAFEAMFGIRLEKIAIPVALPVQVAQVFELTPLELEEDDAAWMERLSQYKQLKASSQLG